MKLLITHKYSPELFFIEKNDIDLTECLRQIGIIQITEYDLYSKDLIDTLTVSQVCDLLIKIFGYKNKSKNLFEKYRQIISQDNVIPAFTESNEINRDIDFTRQMVFINLYITANFNPFYKEEICLRCDVVYQIARETIIKNYTDFEKQFWQERFDEVESELEKTELMLIELKNEQASLLSKIQDLLSY